MFSKLTVLMVVICVQYSVCQFGDEECTDWFSNTPGVCCPAQSCGHVRSDLRRRRPITTCYYNGFTPVVCCRQRCSFNAPLPTPDADTPNSDANIPNSDTQGRASQPRRSERMCEQYNSIGNTQQRSKRYNQYYKYGNHEYHNQWQWHESSTYGYYDSNYPEPVSQPDVPTSTDDQVGIQVGEEGTTSTTKRYPVGAFAIGGRDTSVNEFPHMAAVGWPVTSGGFAFKCGGSLISDRFVLTAGHCLSLSRDSSLSNPEPTIVRLGDQNILDDVTDGADPADVPISRRIPHPNYRPPMKYYDIALLEMEYPITMTNHIKPVCLWAKPTFEGFPVATLTGWGTTVSGGRENSAVLQKVTVDILETSVCGPLLQSAQNRNWQGFSDHQLCAGTLEGGKDACQGDSGGPLQVTSWEGTVRKYFLIGVTSFGRECGKPNLPGVYTRVSAFIDWIETEVWP